jgi:enoyl-CoA hydratase
VSEGPQVAVRLEERKAGVVATVVIDNARRLNSMNSALMGEFVEAMGGLAVDQRLRAVVLTGAGDAAFVGGADIKEMGALRDPHGARAFIGRVHACCDAVRAVPVPVIARIQGFTFGAGLELAASCDLRVAVDGAVFGMPEVRLGIPSVVEAALLPMLVGWGRTRRMLLLGESFSAAEALAWGLVERVVPRAGLDAAVGEWVDQVLLGAPLAVRAQKALIRSWEDLPLRAAVQAGVESFANSFATAEPREAMARFLEAQAARKR